MASCDFTFQVGASGDASGSNTERGPYMDRQEGGRRIWRWLPPFPFPAYRPTPTAPFFRSCPKLSAHSNREGAAG